MLTEKQQERFTALIQDRYGSTAEWADELDLALEMLFHLEKDTYNQREIQRVVCAIRDIIMIFRKPAVKNKTVSEWSV